jgi:hypothetical protein
VRKNLSLSAQKLLLSGAAVALLLGANQIAKADDVTIDIAPSTVEYQYYEPDAKPTKIASNMKGLTEPSWKFSCRLNWEHFDQPPKFKFTIRTAACNVSMPILITLPKDAAEPLRAHEMGHLHINQYFYQKYAEAAIKKAAGAVIGTQLEINADSYDDAKNQVVQRTTQEISKNYRSVTSAPAQKANVLYDVITEHGRKNDVNQEAAAAQAIKQTEESEQSSDSVGTPAS